MVLATDGIPNVGETTLEPLLALLQGRTVRLDTAGLGLHHNEDLLTSLAAELAHARQAGFTMAAKVVRGAYINSETEAGRRAYIQPSKSETDAAYDAAVASLLGALPSRNVADAETQSHDVNMMLTCGLSFWCLWRQTRLRRTR